MRTTLALVAAGLLAVLLVAPGLSPARLAYATSDSMEPTIGVEDGYVVVDAGTVERGDVVTFWSPDRGRYVTHRVVEVTDAGLLTKGDANPFTDQSAGAPPVPRSRVVGEVLTVGGEPVVIPRLGTLAGLLSPSTVAFALVAVLGYGLVAADRPGRSVPFPGDVVVPAFLVTAAIVALLTTAGGGTYQLQYTAVEDPSGNAEVPVGESATREATLAVARPPLTTVLLDSEGVDVSRRTVTSDQVTTAVVVPAQSEPGTVEGTVTVRAYPATLPTAWLDALASIHHWLATIAATTAGLFPLFAVYALLVDRRTPLRQPRWRWMHRRGGGGR